MAVHLEREQTDHHFAFGHHNREGRRHEIGPVRTHDEIDFVDVEKLGVDAGHVRRVH